MRTRPQAVWTHRPAKFSSTCWILKLQSPKRALARPRRTPMPRGCNRRAIKSWPPSHRPAAVPKKGCAVILVVSHAGDDHAVAVLSSLSRAGHAAALVDTSKFPQNACLTERFEDDQSHFQLSIDGNQIDL